MWPELISILALAVMVAITASVPMRPYPTNDSLVLTAANGVDRHSFATLLGYTAFVTIAAPVVLGTSFRHPVAAPHKDVINVPTPCLLRVPASSRWSSLSLIHI